MKLRFVSSKPRHSYFQNNDFDAYNPEIWAREGLIILEANVVAGQLIHRNFEDEVASFGTVINMHRPSTFTSKLKVNITDNVTVQDADTDKVTLTLNRHEHISFLVYDLERQKAFKDLIDEHLAPAMIAIANEIDSAIIHQYTEFLPNAVGALGGGMSKTTFLAGRKKLNDLKCPMMGRWALMSSQAETEMLDIADFVSAEQKGDDGTALREASLGRIYGIDTFMDQNVPDVTVPDTSGAVNNGAGYDAGHQDVIVVDGFVGILPVGIHLTIAGNTGSAVIREQFDTAGNTTSFQLDRPLVSAVVDDAVITVGDTGSYNLFGIKNAITTAVRPLPMPKEGTGVSSGIANWRGYSIRIIMSYDANKQAHLVTVDTLFGVKTLDERLAVVVFS